jgi:hypothetical protein
MKKIGCPICKHYQFDGTCTAFPDGIPMMFLSGQKGHTDRTKFQQNDLVFEWISPEEQGIRRSEAIAKSKAARVAPELVK